MEDKPWWAYACEIIFFACSGVLLWMLLAYSDGADSPHMPFSSSTAGLIAVCIGFCLITWLVVTFLTGKRGGLVDLVRRHLLMVGLSPKAANQVGMTAAVEKA